MNALLVLVSNLVFATPGPDTFLKLYPPIPCTQFVHKADCVQHAKNVAAALHAQRMRANLKKKGKELSK